MADNGRHPRGSARPTAAALRRAAATPPARGRARSPPRCQAGRWPFGGSAPPGAAPAGRDQDRAALVLLLPPAAEGQRPAGACSASRTQPRGGGAARRCPAGGRERPRRVAGAAVRERAACCVGPAAMRRWRLLVAAVLFALLVPARGEEGRGAGSARGRPAGLGEGRLPCPPSPRRGGEEGVPSAGAGAGDSAERPRGRAGAVRETGGSPGAGCLPPWKPCLVFSLFGEFVVPVPVGPLGAGGGVLGGGSDGRFGAAGSSAGARLPF